MLQGAFEEKLSDTYIYHIPVRYVNLPLGDDRIHYWYWLPYECCVKRFSLKQRQVVHDDVSADRDIHVWAFKMCAYCIKSRLSGPLIQPLVTKWLLLAISAQIAFLRKVLFSSLPVINGLHRSDDANRKLRTSSSAKTWQTLNYADACNEFEVADIFLLL